MGSPVRRRWRRACRKWSPIAARVGTSRFTTTEGLVTDGWLGFGQAGRQPEDVGEMDEGGDNETQRERGSEGCRAEGESDLSGDKGRGRGGRDGERGGGCDG